MPLAQALGKRVFTEGPTALDKVEVDKAGKKSTIVFVLYKSTIVLVLYKSTYCNSYNHFPCRNRKWTLVKFDGLYDI